QLRLDYADVIATDPPREIDRALDIGGFATGGAQMVNIAIRPPWDQDLLAEYIEQVVPALRREFS
ncbi:MAG: hypothetical protein ACKOQ1_06465, partial [Actinomycetota bacterium]